MKVWWLDYHPAFNTVNFANDEDERMVRELVKKTIPLSDNWEKYEVVLENKEKTSDILRELGGALIISRRTKEVISQLSSCKVEFLPLTSLDGEFYVMNVLTVLNCVNPDHSKEKRLSSGKLMDYEELELYKDVVHDKDIFKIMLHEGNRVLPKIYVSDQLKALIENQLEGFQLVEMWDSELSWKQKEERYSNMCEEVDKSLKKTFDFGNVVDYVQRNIGKVAYSGKWALKVNDENEILLGQLQLDGSYIWINPVYYPPIILGLIWGTKE